MEKSDLNLQAKAAQSTDAKAVLSIRCHSGIKNALIQEAMPLGITISEHVENILLNRDKVLLSNTQLAVENQNLRNQLQLLDKNARERIKILQAELASTKAEKQQIEANLQDVNDQLEIFKDPRLLKFFAAVKGNRDIIESDGKKFEITYNQPADVLLSLIYSFKNKKP